MIDRHSYGCLMASVPADVSGMITSWAKTRINPQHLGKGGLEDYPHVTVKYGFKDDGPEVLASLYRILTTHGPIVAELGVFSTFEDGGNGEVLFLEVNSPELHRLNRFVSERFPCKDSHSKYVPHITVAYLDPRFSDSYSCVEHLPFQNRRILITEAVWSDRDNNESVISLNLLPRFGGKAMSYLSEGSGGALITPPRMWRPVGGRPNRPRVRSLFKANLARRESGLPKIRSETYP